LAIVDTGKDPEWRLPYRQLNERANRFAKWLKDAAGVGKGDRVAILARDGVEHLDCFFACAKLGAIHTALNWRLHWRETADIIENTTPKVLIYSDDFLESADNLKEKISNCLHIEGNGVSGSRLYESTLSESTNTPVTCESLEAEDIAALIFTGGTTGLPKAAMVSHRMIGWNTLNVMIHDLTHGDVYVNAFPLFHTGGLFVYTLPQVIIGGTTILMRGFDPSLALTLIERERATVFAGVPTMFQMMTQVENWEQADLSSLRLCKSGGEPLPVPIIEKYDREKGVSFNQGFGMTEFGPGDYSLPPDKAISKAGSIGRPVFFLGARVVDDDNNPLGPNQVGELVFKGPTYCSGYFNDPEATAEAVDEEGWFHTGDLARYDEEWDFYIEGRKKDMFLSGGENVYPVEIENALYQHPAVQMCAVIGMPDPKWGEVGKACVVLKPGVTATEEELIAFMKERLAKYKVPKSVEFMESLPVSNAGKILKRELKEQFGA
jgi:fatty-acyl-CoA synthase